MLIQALHLAIPLKEFMKDRPALYSQRVVKDVWEIMMDLTYRDCIDPHHHNIDCWTRKLPALWKETKRCSTSLSKIGLR